MRNLKVIGYWDGPETVKPIDFYWKLDFISLFRKIEDFLNPENVKQNGFRVVAYRGTSICRICKRMNGSREYEGHGVAIPEGYLHYITEHGLIPDPELIKLVKKGF